jgi:CHAT domain-containing protein/tetratricopeptide (TPR) repeat protein
MTRFRFGLLLFVLVSSTAAAARPSPWEADYRKARDAMLFQSPLAALEIVESSLQRAGNANDPWVIALRLYQAEIRALAKREFEKSLLILEKPLPVPLRKTEIEIRRLTGLAMVLHSGGKSSEAMAITDQMVALAKKDVPAMVADAYYMRGNLGMDEADIRTAIRLARNAGDATLALKSETLLVRAFESQRRYAEAVEIGEKVLPEVEKAKMTIAGTLAGNIGSAYFWLGDYESSREFFTRAEATARRLNTAHDLPVWLDRLGDVSLAMHDLNGAARWYGQAEQFARPLRHRQRPRTLSNLAQVAIARGQLPEARRFIEEAIGLFTKEKEWDAVRRVRVIRAALEIASRNFGVAEKELADVIATSNDRFTRLQAETGLGRLYASQQKNALADRHFAQAVKTAVAERGEIHFDYRFSFFNSVENLFDTYVDFLVDSQQIEKALAITEVSRARTLTEGLATTAAAKKTFDPPSIAKRANATILSYWLGTRRSYVWTVTANGVSIRQLPPEAVIDRDLDRYRAVLEHCSLSESAPQGQKLFQTLVAPAARGVAPGSRVMIIADGKLHTLNFETLVVPGPRPYWWIDDVIVTSANSLHLLGRPAAKRTAEPALLLVGNPQRADPAFGPLLNAGQEMQLVGAHFPRRKVLSGAAATPQAFLRAAPATFDLIHFVAHGIATRRQPLDSAVILARDDTDHYKLFARDIVGQHLTARLVTISSCHGAGSRAYAGEGLVGLAWAFLRAGAEQVIAALWEVDDAATTKLMNYMYAQIRRGSDPAVALRDAKRALIHSGTSQQKPRYWAPFVIYAGS